MAKNKEATQTEIRKSAGINTVIGALLIYCGYNISMLTSVDESVPEISHVLGTIAMIFGAGHVLDAGVAVVKGRKPYLANGFY